MAGTNRNISVRAVGDFSNLSQGLQRAQTQIQSFGDRVKSKFKEIGEVGLGLYEVFKVFQEIGEGVAELANRAAELDGGMSSLNRTLGQSAVGYMNWANGTAKSFGISKMSAIEYGKSIAMLLGDVYTNQKQLTQATEQLMQGGAVIAAKTGKSQQEVYEDLNSALMGHAAAVKSLDINVMNNALVHSQAFKQISNGAPWARLTVAQQQYIRVTELNRQIQQKFGNTIGNGMDARMMLFKASLDNVKTALAEAFMPILYKVLPILTTFINWMQTAISYVGSFFQTLFGYSGIQAGAAGAINQHAQAVNALGNAYSTAGTKATKASKALSGGGSSGTKKSSSKASGFTASFDQVHTLGDSSSSSGGSSGSGGSAGGGGGVGSIPVPDTSGFDGAIQKTTGLVGKISDSVKQFADKVKGWLKPLKPYWDNLVSSVGNLGTAIKNLWESKGVQAFVAWLGNATKWAIKVSLTQIADTINNLADVINIVADVLNGNWSKAWSNTKKLFGDLWKQFTDLYNKLGDFGPILTGIGVGLAVFSIVPTIAKAMELWTVATEAFATAQAALDVILAANPFGIIAIAIGAVVAVVLLLIKHWGAVTAMWKGFKEWFTKDVWNPLKSFGSEIGSAFSNLGKKIWSGITKGVGAVKSWFMSTYINPISSAFNGLKSIGSHIWGWITSGFGSIRSWFTSHIVNPIKSAFHEITSGLGGAIESGFKAIYNRAADFLNKIINAFNSVKSKLPFGMGGLIPNVPTIPHLANGGITNGPMMAVIGDNPGGQEVVSPLNKLQDMMASSVGNAVMQALKFYNPQQRSDVGGDINLYINGSKLAQLMLPHLDKERKRVGTNVRLKSI